jgi:hypothetical protein
MNILFRNVFQFSRLCLVMFVIIHVIKYNLIALILFQSLSQDNGEDTHSKLETPLTDIRSMIILLVNIS